MASDSPLSLILSLLDETYSLWRVGIDEPYPLNLSRYFWLLSGQSQRRFEANVLAYGRN